MENDYGSVKMGSYNIKLQPSQYDTARGYELPRMIKSYQMESGGENKGVLTAPRVRVLT